MRNKLSHQLYPNPCIESLSLSTCCSFVLWVCVRDMDPFTEPYWDFLLQIHLFILQKHKSISLLFLCRLHLGIVFQNVYFRYAPPFHVSDSLSYSNTTF